MSIASLPLLLDKPRPARVPTRLPSSAALLLSLLLLQVSFLSAGSDAVVASSVVDLRPTADRPVMLGAEIVGDLTGIAPSGTRDFLLIYASPDCPSCVEACNRLAVLAKRAQSEGITTVLVSAVDEGKRSDFAAACVPGSYGLSDPGSRLARALNVREAPYLALIRDRVRLVALGWEDVLGELNRAETQVVKGQRP